MPTTSPPPDSMPDPDLVEPMPGFGPSPDRPPSDDLIDPMVTSTTDLPPVDPSPNESSSPKSSTRPTTGSSPASSPESLTVSKEAARAELANIVGSAFEVAGVMVHERLTPGDNDCWIPQPHEREMVSGAVASIAVRHMPTGMGVASDLGDAIMAGVGLLLYALNGFLRTPQARRNADTTGIGAGENVVPHYDSDRVPDQ